MIHTKSISHSPHADVRERTASPGLWSTALPRHRCITCLAASPALSCGRQVTLAPTLIASASAQGASTAQYKLSRNSWDQSCNRSVSTHIITGVRSLTVSLHRVGWLDCRENNAKGQKTEFLLTARCKLCWVFFQQEVFYICVCVFTHTCTYIWICVCESTDRWMCSHICIYVWIYTHTRIHIWANNQSSWIHSDARNSYEICYRVFYIPISNCGWLLWRHKQFSSPKIRGVYIQ